MTGHHAPGLAIALLEHFVPDTDALLGDLIEEFERRPSRSWFWWQVLTAIGAATWSFDRPVDVSSFPSHQSERESSFRRWRPRTRR
jgi:hypothetical protein